MARANYNVLILPYIIEEKTIKYCILKRADMEIWQFVSGGGEGDETYLETAKREIFEEINIKVDDENIIQLDSKCSVPSGIFPQRFRQNWGNDCHVINEYSFGLRLTYKTLKLSEEHIDYKWVDYETAYNLLKYDSNRTAMWELDSRIKQNLLKPTSLLNDNENLNNENCVFCKIIKHKEQSNIIFESNLIIAILDIDPINEGHILILPKLHKDSIDKIPLHILNEMMLFAKKVVPIYEELYNAKGYSIMQNGGKFCDFGHFHLHIFPRFDNDGFAWKYPNNVKSENLIDTAKKISKMIETTLK